MDKSFVGMEQKGCPCCGKVFDSGSILLDKRLKKSLDPKTITGVELCDDCKQDGYVTMIECDPTKSKIEVKNGIDCSHVNDVFRTGVVVHIKNDLFVDMFKGKIPEGGFCFVDPEVIKVLERMKGEVDDCNKKKSSEDSSATDKG